MKIIFDSPTRYPGLVTSLTVPDHAQFWTDQPFHGWIKASDGAREWWLNSNAVAAIVPDDTPMSVVADADK